MIYSKTVTLRDGRLCVLRNGTEPDAQGVLSTFILTHGQTEFLTTYPDETTLTVLQEKEYLKKKTENPREVELVAEVDGVITGTAGIGGVGSAEKTSHRASFGIGIDRAAAGYTQLELEVVADNERALSLYKSVGFVEYGRNPNGFISRKLGRQAIVLMRLELK